MREATNIKDHFSTFIIKIASVCNLNCSYCYVYNGGDLSYQQQPVFMTSDIMSLVSSRIVAHCLKHNLRSATISIHGGEPLLVKKDIFNSWMTDLRQIFRDNRIRLTIGLQTNGTKIDNEWIDLFKKHKIIVGVSIDGPKEIHDMHRVDHSGRGSFESVSMGIKLLTASTDYFDCFGGTMSVINPSIGVVDFVNCLRELNVGNVDLRLPLAHHDRLPEYSVDTFSDWLIELFELWIEGSVGDTKIPFFEQIVALSFGLKNFSTESVGDEVSGMIVIESDGGIEPSDNLKICGDQFTKTGLNVTNNYFDDALDLPIVRAATRFNNTLPKECVSCQYLHQCGGGHLAERYSQSSGFDNPSVYCIAYTRLFQHIGVRLGEYT